MKIRVKHIAFAALVLLGLSLPFISMDSDSLLLKSIGLGLSIVFDTAIMILAAIWILENKDKRIL